MQVYLLKYFGFQPLKSVDPVLMKLFPSALINFCPCKLMVRLIFFFCFIFYSIFLICWKPSPMIYKCADGRSLSNRPEFLMGYNGQFIMVWRRPDSCAPIPSFVPSHAFAWYISSFFVCVLFSSLSFPLTYLFPLFLHPVCQYVFPFIYRLFFRSLYLSVEMFVSV